MFDIDNNEEDESLIDHFDREKKSESIVERPSSSNIIIL